MDKIIGYASNMLPYMLVALPIILLVRVIVSRSMKHKSIATTIWHEVGVCLFFLFLVGLASQTIIPKLDFGVSGISITNGGLQGAVNLIPGMVFVDTWRESVVGGYWLYFAINFIGNICMFLPIGFCIPLLWNKVSFRKVALIALGCSVFIELCQLPQARGTDIDDLWLNTLGAVIGYLLYVLLNRRLNNFFRKFKVIAQSKAEQSLQRSTHRM